MRSFLSLSCFLNPNLYGQVKVVLVSLCIVCYVSFHSLVESILASIAVIRDYIRDASALSYLITFVSLQLALRLLPTLFIACFTCVVYNLLQNSFFFLKKKKNYNFLIRFIIYFSISRIECLYTNVSFLWLTADC